MNRRTRDDFVRAYLKRRPHVRKSLVKRKFQFASRLMFGDSDDEEGGAGEGGAGEGGAPPSPEYEWPDYRSINKRIQADMNRYKYVRHNPLEDIPGIPSTEMFTEGLARSDSNYVPTYDLDVFNMAKDGLGLVNISTTREKCSRLRPWMKNIIDLFRAKHGQLTNPLPVYVIPRTSEYIFGVCGTFPYEMGFILRLATRPDELKDIFPAPFHVITRHAPDLKHLNLDRMPEFLSGHWSCAYLSSQAGHSFNHARMLIKDFNTGTLFIVDPTGESPVGLLDDVLIEELTKFLPLGRFTRVQFKRSHRDQLYGLGSCGALAFVRLVYMVRRAASHPGTQPIDYVDEPIPCMYVNFVSLLFQHIGVITQQSNEHTFKIAKSLIQRHIVDDETETDESETEGEGGPDAIPKTQRVNIRKMAEQIVNHLRVTKTIVRPYVLVPYDIVHNGVLPWFMAKSLNRFRTNVEKEVNELLKSVPEDENESSSDSEDSGSDSDFEDDRRKKKRGNKRKGTVDEDSKPVKKMSTRLNHRDLQRLTKKSQNRMTQLVFFINKPADIQPDTRPVSTTQFNNKEDAEAYVHLTRTMFSRGHPERVMYKTQDGKEFLLHEKYGVLRFMTKSDGTHGLFFDLMPPLVPEPAPMHVMMPAPVPPMHAMMPAPVPMSRPVPRQLRTVTRVTECINGPREVQPDTEPVSTIQYHNPASAVAYLQSPGIHERVIYLENGIGYLLSPRYGPIEIERRDDGTLRLLFPRWTTTLFTTLTPRDNNWYEPDDDQVETLQFDSQDYAESWIRVQRLRGVQIPRVTYEHEGDLYWLHETRGPIMLTTMGNPYFAHSSPAYPPTNMTRKNI